jgi:Mg-chelatase subunit ChlD
MTLDPETLDPETPDPETPDPDRRVSEAERLRRWRLVLGGGDDGTGATLAGDDVRIDAALGAIYDSVGGSSGEERRGRRTARSGGLGRSTPAVTRWLGDIRRYFPTEVVQVLQRDAIDRLRLRQLLLEPEMLAAVEPDVHLAALIVELARLLPDESRATARQVVAQVVAELERRFAQRTRASVTGALARSSHTRRPRPADIDWDRTIRANLRTWSNERRTVVPEHLVGHRRRERSLARDVIVAIDQSGSMAESVVYAALFGSVLASMPTLRTSVVTFDTAVVDLTSLAVDPIELLFGVQLGGGTDIAGALGYCQTLVTRPADTVLVMVTDLFEGGDADTAVERFARLAESGVTVVVVLALSDEGAPAHDHTMAARLAEIGIRSIACTPDAFPDLMGAALAGQDPAKVVSGVGHRARPGPQVTPQ